MLPEHAKKLGYTLVELLVVMVIVAILSNVAIKGYMNNLRIERRQDAVLSMQKALLIIQNTTPNSSAMCPNPVTSGSQVKYTDTTNTDNCLSSGSFYYIHYFAAGYPPPITGTVNAANSMLSNETLILKATTVSGKSQANDDPNCATIYLSDQNKIYPTACGS